MLEATKDNLRKSAIKSRDTLPFYSRLRKSALICAFMRDFILKSLKPGSKILCYSNIKSEVQTFSLLTELTKSYEVFLPSMKNGVIHPTQFISFESCTIGKFSTLQSSVVTESKKFDLVVIPGLLFDRSKNRLGYGMGCYDRLLMNSQGLKIGLAFKSQLEAKIPIDVHDVPMDYIITEDGII